VKYNSLIPTIACALLISAGAALCSELPRTAFLPPAGQTVHYRFSDTVTTPQGTKSVAGLLTLRRLPENNVQATIAVDGKQSRRLTFHVEPTGALEPVSPLKAVSSSSSEQPRSGKNQQKDAAQVLPRAAVSSGAGGCTAGRDNVLSHSTVCSMGQWSP
jgi:hypothetical protein